LTNLDSRELGNLAGDHLTLRRYSPLTNDMEIMI